MSIVSYKLAVLHQLFSVLKVISIKSDILKLLDSRLHCLLIYSQSTVKPKATEVLANATMYLPVKWTEIFHRSAVFFSHRDTFLNASVSKRLLQLPGRPPDSTMKPQKSRRKIRKLIEYNFLAFFHAI